MFVRKSVHEKLCRLHAEDINGHTQHYNRLANMHNQLQAKWNELVAKINAKGGRDFVDHGVIPDNRVTSLTDADIERLIRLCHPDKHNNSEAANQATVLLLSLRKTVKN